MNTKILDCLPGDTMMIGEVRIDGQNRDVWCNSKKSLTDSNMYLVVDHFTDPKYAITPSCNVLYHASGITMNLLVRTGSECLSSGTILADFFLCE
jgi:hypothetical protein